jgi:feruloyl esterase
MRISAGVITLFLLSVAFVASAATAADCVALQSLTLPGMILEITSAKTVPEGIPPAAPFAPPILQPLPAHCLVEGMLDKRTGVGGVSYAIGFAIAMPDDWNGRFLFQGGGGLNGNVARPLGQAASGDSPALSRGFAVVTTDSGHQSQAVFDAAFFADQEAALNFFYQAVGKVTVAAKEIVATYYGNKPERSYFMGCSTGGREAMIMSQRYPGYFDGIVAGAPAMRTDYSNLGMRHLVTAFNRVAPQDDQGQPIVSQAFSDADKQLILDSLRKSCDARDGMRDGLIADTLGCDFDPASLVCKAEKNASCLSQAQVEALHDAFGGPKDSRGFEVYPGYLYDIGIGDSGRGAPGLLHAGQSPVGPPVMAMEQDVDREAAAAAGSLNGLGDSHLWTNLSSFTGHGGKLIFYHGVSDPWFSALDTVDYYLRLARDNGGEEQTAQWSRLLLVPGMGHCGGGSATLDRFDLLTAIIRWVEDGAPPDRVTATGTAFPGRSRPLCPFPAHAHYRGEGDSEREENFICRR